MRIWIPVLFALAACGSEALQADDSAVVVRAFLDGAPGAAGGSLILQTEYDLAGEIEIPTPAVEGLEFLPVGDPVVEAMGEREVVSQKYAFSGSKGSYVIEAMTATWRGPEGDVLGASSPLFVDLGVEPPGRDGEVFDIQNPSRVWVLPWGPVCAVGGVGLFMFGGIVLAFRKDWSRSSKQTPPEPPDLVAIRRWEAVRGDSARDDFQKAQALSRIFRDYAEAVLSFPASAWTTTEILARLRGMAHLVEGNVPRARRLLRATDRVKYAEQQPGRDFFEDLDADLRAFVGSTRPHAWTPPEPGKRPSGAGRS